MTDQYPVRTTLFLLLYSLLSMLIQIRSDQEGAKREREKARDVNEIWPGLIWMTTKDSGSGHSAGPINTDRQSNDLTIIQSLDDCYVYRYETRPANRQSISCSCLYTCSHRDSFARWVGYVSEWVRLPFSNFFFSCFYFWRYRLQGINHQCDRSMGRTRSRETTEETFVS